jgi:hypothetical protein
MILWLKQLLDKKHDPVYSCELYNSADGCVHVDSFLCDFPNCEMLATYKQKQESRDA